MKAALYLKKIGMTQYMHEDGKIIPVTVLEYYDCDLLSKKEINKHGYDSWVVGYSDIDEKKLNKPKLEYFKKLKKKQKKYINEFRFDLAEPVGQKDNTDEQEGNVEEIRIKIDSFEAEDKVNLKGTSKGKGFQGTIRAHNFSRGPMTHGSKNHRRPGSIGAGTDPARVYLGTKMGKRTGDKVVTIKNLEIVFIDKDKSLIFIKGAVPGCKNTNLLMYK